VLSLIRLYSLVLILKGETYSQSNSQFYFNFFILSKIFNFNLLVDQGKLNSLLILMGKSSSAGSSAGSDQLFQTDWSVSSGTNNKITSILASRNSTNEKARDIK